MRLIDADPLYAVMKKERDRIAENYGENDEYVQCLNNYAMSMVSSAPTIDAVPVKHGKWITKGQDIFCSVCGEESAYTWHGSSKFSNYCPNCGSKMDGGKDDEHTD